MQPVEVPQTQRNASEAFEWVGWCHCKDAIIIFDRSWGAPVIGRGNIEHHLEQGWGGQSRECSQSASVQSSGKSWSQPSWKLFLGTWRRCLGIVSANLPRGNGAWLTWLPFVVRWLDQGMRGEQKMSPALTLAILLICSATWKTVMCCKGWWLRFHTPPGCCLQVAFFRVRLV